MQLGGQENSLDAPPQGVRWERDVLWAACIFGVVCLFSAAYLAIWTKVPEGYWQAPWLGPSAMMAEGHGFVYPVKTPPAMNDFLNHKTETLAPGAIPRNIETQGVWAFHEAHRYLLYTVAAAWRIFGVSWTALIPVLALLSGLSAIAAFALFRLAMPRWLAALATFLFIVSPAHLKALPLLRDYGKAPFFIATLAILGFLIARPLRLRPLLLLSLLLGLVCGVGVGFRMDVKVCYLAGLIVLLFFLPGSFRATMKLRLAALAVFFATVQIVGYPIFHPHDDLNMSAHAAQGGFVEVHDRPLGLGGAPYTWTRLMNDYFMFSYVEAQAHFVDKEEAPIDYLTAAHQRAGVHYLLALFETFPADTILRGYSAVLRILQFSTVRTDPWNPDEMTLPNAFVGMVEDNLGRVYGHLVWFAPLYALAGLLILGARQFRLGIAGFFMLFFFGGYCVLQFANRHYFHLAVLPIFCTGFALMQAVRGVTLLIRDPAAREALRDINWSAPLASPTLKRVLVFAGLALAVVVVPLELARAVQSWRVGGLYHRYADAELEQVPFEALKDNPQSGVTLLKPTGLFQDKDPAHAKWNTQTEVLVLKLDNKEDEKSGPNKTMWFWPRYSTPAPAIDFTYYAGDFPLFPGLEGPVLHFEPVFEAPQEFHHSGGIITGGRKFEGLAVLNTQMPRVMGLYRMKNPGATGFITALTVPAGAWASVPRRQYSQPCPAPAPLRGALARASNLLSNGGFEHWSNGKPEDVTVPLAGSTVTQDLDFPAFGNAALRQTWQQKDIFHPPAERLAYHLRGLRPGTTYELQFKVNLLGGAAPLLDICAGNPAIVIARKIPKPATPGYHDYLLQFTVPKDYTDELLIVTGLPEMPEHVTDPVEALWDDFRLAVAPEYGEARRY